MAATTPAHSISHDQSPEAWSMMDHWTDIWSPATVSRVAGACALANIAILLASLSGPYHADLPAAQVVAWAGGHQRDIWMGGFLSGLANTVFVLALVLLAALAANSRLLTGVAQVGAAAALATGWTRAGAMYALADLAHRGGADAGVLALFSLAKTADYTDGKAFGLAIGAVCVLLLRARALPRPVLWLGLVLAADLLLATPIQLALTGTGNGPQGPLSVALGLLWGLALGITLLVRPVRRPEAPTMSTQATV